MFSGNADLSRDSLCGTPVVAGDHPDGKPLLTQLLYSFHRANLDRIGDRDQPDYLAIDGGKHHCLPLPFHHLHVCLQSSEGNSTFAEQPPRPHKHTLSFTLCPPPPPATHTQPASPRLTA